MNTHPTRGQNVTATTPAGNTRHGTLIDYELRACQTTPTAREYEAIVRWDGDDYDSRVSPDRLTAATDPEPEPTPGEAAQDALADINAIWASWTTGRLDTDDAMTAICDHLTAARENGALQ